ncbi:MAG: phosphate uptake regulator PhoU [Candidatus Thermoplasmatota archaeon]|nr:phosphate uptake regulator PhoU [Candidatus Thermoplasmatota archaeon]
MAKQTGDKDVRKLQFTGGATFTLSLPKAWIQSHGLESRDGVQIDWRPSGALRLTPFDIVEDVKKISLSTSNIPEGALLDHLMGAYLSGTDRIVIRHKGEESRMVKRVVRTFQRSTRGFEIEDEKEHSITLITLLNAGELPMRSSLNQMYMQLNSLVRDTFDVLSGDDSELIEDYEEREREIDSLRFLIERQAGITLDSYKVAERLNLGRRQAVEYANLARSLERMADHTNQLARLAIENNGVIKISTEQAPLNQIPVWQDAIRTLMINIRTKDAQEIEIARNSLKAAQNTLKEHERSLWSGRKDANKLLFEDHISESVRRLCAYARDFGEILLNMLAHEMMVTERRRD